MAQLVEALRYKPEGRGFDSGWCRWNFSLTKSFQPHYGPGVDSASHRNEYQEYFLGGKAGRCLGWQTYDLHVPTVLKSVSLNLLEPSGPLQACNGIDFSLSFFLSFLFFFFIISFMLLPLESFSVIQNSMPCSHWDVIYGNVYFYLRSGVSWVAFMEKCCMLML